MPHFVLIALVVYKKIDGDIERDKEAIPIQKVKITKIRMYN